MHKRKFTLKREYDNYILHQSVPQSYTQSVIIMHYKWSTVYAQYILDINESIETHCTTTHL